MVIGKQHPFQNGQSGCFGQEYLQESCYFKGEKMIRENRNGTELEISELENGIKKLIAANWGMPLTWYTDIETRNLMQNYEPDAIRQAVEEFRKKEQELCDVVAPLIAVSLPLREFGGTNAEGYKTVAAWHQYHVAWGTDNPEARERAIREGYLRTTEIEGNIVYFPTEKAVQLFCDTKIGTIIYSLGLHTGTTLGASKRPLPDWTKDPDFDPHQ